MRDVPKPVQKPPADAALDTFREQGKMCGFQRFEIAADRAGMFGEIGRKGCKKFIEGKAPRRPFQPLQHVPLTRDLIVARHDHRKDGRSAARIPKRLRRGKSLLRSRDVLPQIASMG